jgi:bifunctional DNA-binding transcriptional regulator/antitoxin component of YhaV-PrlF toxin-antitoxin module
MTMPVEFTVRVIQNEKSLRVTIPKELAAHLELKKGDSVIMWSDNSHILIKKKQ